jgi:predicted unusual protein kinase regulating ubiquinone biosynthesis (AarF/ABC1/UbiB family)
MTVTKAVLMTTTRFCGPLTDGPTPEQLRVEAPSLEQFGLRDLQRLVHVAGVMVWSVLAAIARRWRRSGTTLAAAASEGLVDGLIKLGPMNVKLGQIIASSGTLFPPVLAAAARRCLDAVPTFPVEDVHRAIEEDLGLPVEELFASFDDVPLSAASIGQVHACVLRDGRDAVVKVQRPDIRDQMIRDLRCSYRLAWLVEHTPWGRRTNAQEIIRDLHGVTFQELNPVLEAWQQDRFRSKIGAFGDNTLVTAPEIYWDHCGPQVICMERVYGTPMDDFATLSAKGVDGQTVLRRGAKVWAEAVMIHGPFHGDMHAGNIWALEDGRGCYLDFGIMGELPDEWKQVLKDLFYTCAFDLDFVRVARAYRSVGAVPAGLGTDEELGALMQTIFGPLLTEGFGTLDMGTIVTQSLEMLKAYDARVPRELVLIAKQLLYVDKYTTFLAPEYSLTADPYVVKNIFPEEAAARAAELGMSLADDAVWVRPDGAAGNAVEVVVAAPPQTDPEGSLMALPFLSAEWIDAMRDLRDELAPSAPADLPAVVVNLTVTDVPFGDGTVLAHGDTSGGRLDLDLGHRAEAAIHLTLNHDTARKLVLGQDPQDAMRAFLLGKIKLEGDLSGVLGEDVDPMALLASFDLTGGTTLADLDPAAADLAERIKTLTA